MLTTATSPWPSVGESGSGLIRDRGYLIWQELPEGVIQSGRIDDHRIDSRRSLDCHFLPTKETPPERVSIWLLRKESYAVLFCLRRL
jgi:hypothetical protein